MIGRNDPLGQSFGMHFFANTSFVQELDGNGRRQLFLEVQKIRCEAILRRFAFHQAQGFSPFGKDKIDFPLFLVPKKMQPKVSLSHGLPQPDRLPQMHGHQVFKTRAVIFNFNPVVKIGLGFFFEGPG